MYQSTSKKVFFFFGTWNTKCMLSFNIINLQQKDDDRKNEKHIWIWLIFSSKVLFLNHRRLYRTIFSKLPRVLEIMSVVETYKWITLCVWIVYNNNNIKAVPGLSDTQHIILCYLFTIINIHEYCLYSETSI